MLLHLPYCLCYFILILSYIHMPGLSLSLLSVKDWIKLPIQQAFILCLEGATHFARHLGYNNE